MGNSKNGFALAEVLITLLIIGVVASLVIPGLISDTQDAEFHAAWKKTYSSIQQAYSQILMDNGGTFANAATGNNTFLRLFRDKMNYVTTCNDTSCAADSLKRLNGDLDGYSFLGNIVLNNGSILSVFQLDSPSCTHSNYVYNSAVECGWMLVDVNGKKGPNQWGKDIYGIWVTKNQILPWGANPTGTASGSFRESTCNDSGSGYGCGAKYLYN